MQFQFQSHYISKDKARFDFVFTSLELYVKDPNLMFIKSINYSVSHVLFLSTQTALASYDQVVIIYLRIATAKRPSICSIPFGECPYHNLGFSLVGFTSFHLTCFHASSVTVAPSGSFGRIRRLRRSFRRQSLHFAYPYFFR